MARGIIYIMTSVVPGLIKIGKTGINNFDQRMYQLERHGYSNITGLKREFAIEVGPCQLVVGLARTTRSVHPYLHS